MIVRTAHIDNSTQFAAGDLHATAEDMYSWLRALDSDVLLRHESRDLMLQPYIETEMSYVGRTHMMNVTREGNRLMVEVQGLPKTELRPLGLTSYFAQMKG
jgi:hypothetical protein